MDSPAESGQRKVRWGNFSHYQTLLAIRVKLATPDTEQELGQFLTSPVDEALECGIKSHTFCRIHPVPAGKFWSRMLDDQEDLTTHWKNIDNFGIKQGMAFPVSQVATLISFVNGGKHYIDVGEETSTYVFCQIGSRTALLEMLPMKTHPMNAVRWDYVLHLPDQVWFRKGKRILFRAP